jgi:hypothetical protein
MDDSSVASSSAPCSPRDDDIPNRRAWEAAASAGGRLPLPLEFDFCEARDLELTDEQRAVRAEAILRASARALTEPPRCLSRRTLWRALTLAAPEASEALRKRAYVAWSGREVERMATLLACARARVDNRALFEDALAVARDTQLATTPMADDGVWSRGIVRRASWAPSDAPNAGAAVGLLVACMEARFHGYSVDSFDRIDSVAVSVMTRAAAADLWSGASWTLYGMLRIDRPGSFAARNADDRLVERERRHAIAVARLEAVKAS